MSKAAFVGVDVVLLSWRPAFRQAVQHIRNRCAQTQGRLDDPDLPRGITSFGAAVIGDWLYVYGGHFGRPHHYSNTSQSDQLSRLNLGKDSTWGSNRHGSTTARAGHGSLRRQAVPGGWIHGPQPRGRRTTTCARWPISSASIRKQGKWEPLPSLPEPRSSHDSRCDRGQALRCRGLAPGR